MGGDHAGALAVLAAANPADLGKDYCAEAFLTRTLILLNLGRLDDAKAAIDECRRLTVRASTERNLLLHEARWQVLTGRIDEAITTFHRARDHRWPCQGGSGCLALGDAFRDVGRLDLARECWSLAVERDPESHSAKLARERLA
ncbi:MAG: tetratricopeptide repeat protein [Myxococcales bacterium]|nr:tetratricopeptide repeat protein [Myxococcales bacterium]